MVYIFLSKTPVEIPALPHRIDAQEQARTPDVTMTLIMTCMQLAGCVACTNFRKIKIFTVCARKHTVSIMHMADVPLSTAKRLRLASLLPVPTNVLLRQPSSALVPCNMLGPLVCPKRGPFADG